MPRNANQSKQSNYSMDFDGTNYIDCGTSSSLDLPGNFTISFWFNADSFTNYPHILSKIDTNYYGWRIQLDATDIRLQSTTNSTYARFKASRPSNTNQWYSVIFTFDGTNVLYYLDGQATTLTNDGPTSTWITPVSSGKNFRIAKSPTIQPGFNGKIDGVAIFDYALSSSQVTTLWGGGTSVSNPMALPSPPIAYYPLGTSAWNGNFLAENNAIGDYVFDFDADYIDCGSPSSLDFERTDAFSISAWVKRVGSGSNQSIVYKANNNSPYNGYAFYIDTNNKVGFNITIDYFANNYFGKVCTSVLNTDWNNVLITYNGNSNVSGLNIYINGRLQTVTTVGTSSDLTCTLSNSITFNIGARNNTDIFFDGVISNVQIFNTPLTEPEVETLYNYGSPIRTLANIPQNSNLKAWYKLDASEIYNSSSTEWSVDNNANTSTYDTSINLVRASSQKIDIANGSELDFTGDFTMSIWVNLTTSSNNMGVFNKTSQANTNGVSLFKRGGANFEFYVSEFSNVLTFASQGDNIWQQITITLNRTTGERIAYVNGEQAATLTHIKTFTFPNQGWDIGTFANNSPNYLDAKVSNFKLFNSVLSPTEVQTLYNNGTPLTDMSSFTSLQGWWKLNNLSSGLTDSSSNSNNATATSTTTEYPGFVNALAGDSSGMSQSNLVQSDLQTVAPYSKYALAFDGTNDYIDCGNDSSLKLASNFSISVWMKSSNQQSFAVAVGNNSVFSLQMSATLNKFRFNVYSSGWQEAYYSLNPIDDDKWHHVVATHDGSTIKVYVDNVKGTDASAGAIPSNTAPFLIGYLPGNAGLYFDGQISNVSYWNTALTQAQVTETYNEGLPSDLNSHSAYSNLVSWWQLGSNSSWNGNRWIVADGKGTNNGYSQNMAPYMPESGLTNGVGTTANGTSTGMGVGALVGDAPYSTANAVSSGMAVTARGTDVP